MKVEGEEEEDVEEEEEEEGGVQQREAEIGGGSEMFDDRSTNRDEQVEGWALRRYTSADNLNRKRLFAEVREVTERGLGEEETVVLGDGEEMAAMKKEITTEGLEVAMVEEKEEDLKTKGNA
ncbi:hypothetical protein C0Q70_19514 [Pomacea canaliculata]|uniref:Uncharacterized protein n=1 Tax=Pomacea canaliculata TaxID=400727 RepID=A0A2T7NJJ8_POMCA|nr:hypothetical protein C0Q70_19514 [Pomacea canaliculata]